jgi:hypothetical protein
MKLHEEYLKLLSYGYHPVHFIDQLLVDKLKEDGKLLIRYSEDYEYYKVNYGKMAHVETFEEYNWLLACRGDVVRASDGKVMAKAPNKFFNLNENKHVTEQVVKDMTNINHFIASEKMDGILIVPFIDTNGKLVFTTRGSFTEERLDVINKYIPNIQEYEYFVKMCNEMDIYPIFELVCPESFIKVQYPKEKYGVWFTNASDIYGNIYNPCVIRSKLMKIFKTIPYSGIKNFTTIEKAIQYVNSFNYYYDYEGLVLTYNDIDLSVKIKATKYMEMNIDDFARGKIETIYDLWASNTLDDVIAILPSTIQDKVNDIVKNIEQYTKELRSISYSITSEQFATRKDCVCFIKTNFPNKYFDLIISTVYFNEYKIRRNLRALVIEKFKNNIEYIAE